MPVMLPTKTSATGGIPCHFMMLLLPKIILAAYVAIGARIQRHPIEEEVIPALIGVIITGGIHALLVLTLQDRQNNNPSRDLLLKVTNIASVVSAPLMGTLCYPTTSSPSHMIVDGLIGAGIVAYFQLLDLSIATGFNENEGYYVEIHRNNLEPIDRTTWGFNLSFFQTYFKQQQLLLPVNDTAEAIVVPV